ncbi:hypothetical protein Q7P37_010961 [Cladosporium fusiforme]
MLSANIIAILSAGLLPAALALPVAENQSPATGDFMALFSGENPSTLATENNEKRQVDGQGLAAKTTPDIPVYCRTNSETDNVGKEQYYIDLSQNVQDAGLGENACVNFIVDPHYTCSTVGPEERIDLKKAVQQMRQKDGLWSQTLVGVWHLSFELFGNNKAPFDIVQHWNAGIDSIPWDNNPLTDQLNTIMLTFDGTIIRADKFC